jgi:hypothetical protein
MRADAENELDHCSNRSTVAAAKKSITGSKSTVQMYPALPRGMNCTAPIKMRLARTRKVDDPSSLVAM